MKPFYFLVMDAALDHSTNLIAAYEMQKASSSWVHPDAVSTLFPEDAKIFHMTQGSLEIDGGLKDCACVQSIICPSEVKATEQDYLLLDSGLHTQPTNFPGFMDATNDWLWKLILTNKAVFRWVSEACMPEWNPVYRLYTKAELSSIIDDAHLYDLFKEMLDWKKQGDTLFLKAPVATRGEGNQEVPYTPSPSHFKKQVAAFDSDLILVEQAKGFGINEGAAAQYRSCRLGIFYQSGSDPCLRVVMMAEMAHSTHNSHDAKRTKREEVQPIENIQLYQTFFERMGEWSTLDQIRSTLQQGELTSGQRTLCRQILQYYLKHFYDLYCDIPWREDLKDNEELTSLLTYLLTYLHHPKNNILEMSTNDDKGSAYARSWVRMLVVLSCHLQHQPMIELLFEKYETLTAIQDRFIQSDSLYFDLTYLNRPDEAAISTAPPISYGNATP